MTLQDATTEDLKAAAMRALETLEGNNLYTSGPWPIDVRPMASPMKVIYYAADGKSYEREMTPELVGDSLNVVLGERREVEARTLWVPVQGDVAPAFAFSAGKTTVWSGLIFRAGDYPDKGCSFGEDDLKAFVANFPTEGVPVMSEHEDSLLGRAMDRHGARLTKIWNVGGELHGEIKSPSWLDEALQGMRKSVSVGIDFAAKTLREISLTFSPRVADAAVFQHKAAVAFTTSPDFKTFAQSHPSEAAELVTEALKAPSPAPTMLTPQQIQDAAWNTFSAIPENAGVGKDAFLAAFATPAPQPQTPQGDPALLQRIADLEAQQATFAANAQKDEDQNAALGFYADNLQKGKVVPAEKEFVLANFAAARAADRATLATFSANAEGSHEARIRKAYEERPAQFRMGDPLLPSFADVPNPTGAAKYGGLGAHFEAEDAAKKEAK